MGLASPLRIVFLGTPPFAVPTLRAILDAGHLVVEVATQPDRPKGRRGELAQSAVKEFALSKGLPVFQPDRIKKPEPVEHLRSLAPDLMVVVGYGQILSQAIIDIAPLGIVNVHASLLPQWRGAAPIQWSIWQGDQVTGVTTMQIDKGLDTGAMLLKAETPIHPDEDAVALSHRLAEIGAELLIRTIKNLESIRPEPQDNSQATLARILTKDDGRIDWNRTASQIHNQIRGFQPWPGAFTTFREHMLHIWKSRPLAERHTFAPGMLIAGHGAHFACGEGTVLEALELQSEGRKRVSAEDFMNGLHLKHNEVVGAPKS